MDDGLTYQDKQRPAASGGELKWHLRHHPNVKSSIDASFPGQTLPIAPPFIRVTVGTESANFRAYVRARASGSEIFVSNETWQNVNDGAACTYMPISKIRYNWDQLIRGSRGRVVLVGVVILIIGTVIQGALAVGKLRSFFTLTDGELAALAIFGLALQVIGAFLAFFEKELLKE
jgi:hypothetical protein